MRLNLLFVLFLQLITAALFGQQDNIVAIRPINLPVHKANTGKIIFTAEEIPVTALNGKEFLSGYQLTNKSNLFMTVFMDNSITNYMHRLAPGLTADSLVKIGNYQFTLFVDGKMIYRSNLLPGAPLAATQDTATIISKPLIDNQHERGFWTQYFWYRFMNNGGDSALTEGHHRLKMEIRPYVQRASELNTGDIIATGELNLDVRRKPVINTAAIRLNPIKPYDDLTVSKEKFDSNKIKELKGNIEAGIFKHINSIIVIKNGKLLVEEYFDGEDRNSLHDPRSVGKSFASTMMGIAIHDGYLKNEEQQLKEFYDLHSFDNYTTKKLETTIRDLLTMSSSFDGDDNTDSPGNEENMYPTPDWVKFTLDLPATRSRHQWHYFTAGVVVLGDILNKTIPGGLEKYADQNLFAPLNINDYRWGYTPQKVPNTAGGIRLKALDFAKYGQLYKNGGVWKGQQLIPKEWIKKTFTPYKPIPGTTDEYYGYLFWNKKYIVKGKKYETFYCSGNGGNKIFVFSDQPLVIVITASAYGIGYAHKQVDKMMTDYILPAVIQ